MCNTLKMTELTKCPLDIRRRALILSCNGFGFQSPGDGVDNMFVICRLHTSPCDKNGRVPIEDGKIDDEQCQIINKKARTTTVGWIDFLLRYYLTVHWSEYDKIESIINATLEVGYAIVTQNSLKVLFQPTESYTRENEELKCINQIGYYMCYSYHESDKKKTYIEKFNERICIGSSYIMDRYLSIWNWKTEQGKKFCRFLNKEKGTNFDNIDHDDNYYNWTIFKNCDLKTLQTITINESEEECLVCYYNKPDVMVLPCGHCVVCKECSIRLKDTNDAKICIKCRRPISNILE